MRPFCHEGQVTVDGETLTLVLDFMAIDVMESLTEQKLSEILPQMVDPPTALAGKVLWAMLRRKHEGVTIDEAASIIFSPQRDDVAVVIGDIFRRACNLGEEPKAKGKNPRGRRGRSKTSDVNG